MGRRTRFAAARARFRVFCKTIAPLVPFLAGVAFLLFLSPSVPAHAQQVLRARVQPSVPEGWIAKPFDETAPEPMLSESERRRGFVLFQRPITEPVYPNSRPRDHERTTSLVAFGTPGEFEPLTFTLYPIGDLENLQVHCSGLSSSTSTISASQIDTRLLTYWNIGFPKYTSRDTYRRLPELLERVTVHSSPAKECQRWWLTVHVPGDASPGLYTGTVTLQGDGFTEPVQIPLRFRVLGFRLQQDPRKRLSAYYYPRNRTLFQGRDDAFIDRATANEYRSMIEHGLNMLPTFYLQLDRSTEKIVVQESAEIERMLAVGLKGPLPVLGGNAIERIYQKTTPAGKRGSHWQINQMPPPEFYQQVTESFRQLKNECADRGWPEIICCPLDEVSASRSEFGAKVYQAVHDAGVRTYATKNPLAMDAVAYRPFVDVWCSQPYALPYQKVVADTQHEYWSYPNHNAGERKNRRVMCKGGRMTYGFGFWRSGYTTLIPWHWAWTMSPDPFDYLRTPTSGAGQRIDEAGEVIPAVYWECFREGIDDARYLFTLQQTAWERVGSTDADCQRAVKEARELLQETWTAVDVQEKYLAEHMWPSSEFNARRWLLAMQIERLRKFPAQRQGLAPSVYLDNAAQTSRPELSTVEQATAPVHVEKQESVDLGEDFSDWKSETPESSIQVLPPSENNKSPDPQNATLRWNVHVDHLAGGTADGQYQVGWPRVRRSFQQNDLDMAAYDFLEVVVRVDSDRDEVQDDVTLLGLSLSSHDARRLYETQRDLGDRQREEHRLLYSISEMIREADKGVAPWKSVAYLQFFVSEANYPHQAALQFDIQGVRLLRYKMPILSQLDAPKFIMLPRAKLPIPFELMGMRSVQPGSHRLAATLTDTSNRQRSRTEFELDQDRPLVLDTSNLTAGKYRLDVEITTKAGKRCDQTSRNITALNGPAA